MHSGCLRNKDHKQKSQDFTHCNRHAFSVPGISFSMGQSRLQRRDTMAARCAWGLNLTQDPRVPVEGISVYFHQACSLWKSRRPPKVWMSSGKHLNFLGAVPSKLELSGFRPLGPIFSSVWAFLKDQNTGLAFPVLYVIRSSSS